ncbi:ion channel [Jannaschia faecimaris]|uniref:ion channel n=1 Tax=Jannaschia faecimaris TaxID=1244108 RepID=UPI000B8561A3|nr:ion channel [Jannaschia faecimaris]
MLLQLILGSALIVATAVMVAPAWWALELMLIRMKPWMARPPHGIKLMATLCLTMLWSMLMVTGAVWIWALALLGLGVFSTLELSIYFALVSFTTLGFGDVLLPVEWRILGALSAANGLLIFGILTAMLVETMRQVRQSQRLVNLRRDQAVD